ncbi:MAG: protein-disulfide reductase DsbD [Pseudomonadota bacterium]
MKTKNPIALLLTALMLSLSGLVTAQELLPEEQAFSVEATKADNLISIRWDIADGYYMYKDRIGLEIDGAELDLNLPKGKMKWDMALTGVEEQLEVFTGSIEFSVETPADLTSDAKVVALGQGCNEPIGVCYPPMKRDLALELLAEDANAAEAVPLSNPINTNGLLEVTNPLGVGDSMIQPMIETIDQASESEDDEVADSVEPSTENELSSIEQLRDLLSLGLVEDDFLDVDDAFKIKVASSGDNSLNVSFDIADGYYLYREKTTITGEGNARLAAVDLPPGVMKVDDYFGEMEVYKKDFILPIKLLRQDPDPTTFTVETVYQGCAEDGICYAPVSKSFTLELPQLVSTAAADEIDTASPAGSAPRSVTSLLNPAETTPIFWIMVGALVAGIGLAFTPCVLPMIPILSSVIAGQGENLTRTRGGTLAIVYVAGSAVTYAAMGAIAGATGDQLQAYFQTPLAIGILCAILIVMALSLFGLFRVQMPSAIQSALQTKTDGFGGKVPMVFVLGLVSALIVGACVSPILISFLGLAISKADPTLGAGIMVLMALGMGIPLILFGFGAGHVIPRAGKWMDTVNHVFGVMLIGVAIYLLQALPDVPVLLLWGVFLIVISIYMGATSSLPAGSSGWQRLFKGTGTVMLIWGTFALIGGFFGERDILRPLPDSLFQRGSIASSEDETGGLHLFTRVNNESELEQQLLLARNQGKNVMIDYYADWCVDCVRMEKTTFTDMQVVSRLQQDFVTLQVDVTDPKDQDRKALKRRFGVFGPPAVLFFDQQGIQRKDLNFYGYRKSDEFLAIVDHL